MRRKSVRATEHKESKENSGCGIERRRGGYATSRHFPETLCSLWLKQLDHSTSHPQIFGIRLINLSTFQPFNWAKPRTHRPARLRPLRSVKVWSHHETRGRCFVRTAVNRSNRTESDAFTSANYKKTGQVHTFQAYPPVFGTSLYWDKH